MPFDAPATVASQATTGYLSQFFLGTDGSPITYQSIAELKSFSGKHGSVSEVNVTHLLSPDSTEELRAGLIKPGTYEISGNFIGDASQLALYTAMKNAAAQNPPTQPMKATAPAKNGTMTYTMTCIGYVSSVEIGPFENNKSIDFKATIQITGGLVEAVA